MDPAEAIRRLVKARNRELALEATIGGVLGIVYTVITFAVVFWLSWLLGLLLAGLLRMRTATLIAAIMTGVYALTAFVAAWRRINPFADMERFTDAQWTRFTVLQFAGYGVVASPRRALAGAAALLIGGPAAILEAIGTWNHRLRAGSTVVVEAVTLLTSARDALDIDRVTSPAAGVLLQRLGLIRVAPVAPGSPRLVVTLTGKGRSVLG